MSAVHALPTATDWTHELAALRSHADFAIVRPLQSRRHGRVGGLRGQMLQTQERIRIWIRGDTSAITFANDPSGRTCPIDPDLWPWIELEVEAARRSMAQPFVAGQAQLSLNGSRVTIDARVHDLGVAPAGGPWAERHHGDHGGSAAAPARRSAVRLADAAPLAPVESNRAGSVSRVHAAGGFMMLDLERMGGMSVSARSAAFSPALSVQRPSTRPWRVIRQSSRMRFEIRRVAADPLRGWLRPVEATCTWRTSASRR